MGRHSPAALRRAVDRAQVVAFPDSGGMESYVRTSAIADLDGWPCPGRARERCESVGRTEPLTICFTPVRPAAVPRRPGGWSVELVDGSPPAAMGVDRGVVAGAGSGPFRGARPPPRWPPPSEGLSRPLLGHGLIATGADLSQASRSDTVTIVATIARVWAITGRRTPRNPHDRVGGDDDPVAEVGRGEAPGRAPGR